MARIPTAEQVGSCRIERITRTPFVITLDRALAGATSVYFGRWVTTKKSLVVAVTGIPLSASAIEFDGAGGIELFSSA